MNKEDIKNYFDLYVLNYQPYKNIPEYQSIIKTLVDFYFDHAYNSINLPFKQAFEQQFIPIEFYEKLLLSIGFPKKIISILTNKDKKILLHSFMDYNRYKGTIEQVRLVGEKFAEDVGIYELFIDLKDIIIPFYKLYAINGKNYFNLENVNLYNKLEPNDIIVIDSITYSIVEKRVTAGVYRIYLNKEYIGENLEVEDFVVKRWVFIPEALYIAPNVTKLTEYFDYEKIYQDTKRYFVSAEFLTASYENENLVLPIKSNLLFLDYKKYQEINVFNNLLAAIFLKEFYNSKIVITFEEDKQYLITLGRLVKLWYYILLKFYNYDLIDSSPNNVLTLDITDVNFDYAIFDDIHEKLEFRNTNSMSRLIGEYNNLKDSDEFSQFYYDKITSKFRNVDQVSRDISIEEYELMLENEVGIDLITYLKNRLSNSTSEFREYEYNFILDEIYNSLITWSIFESESVNGNKLIPRYIGYLLKNLSFINYPIDMSPTYNLIMFLKPYHVELINEITEGVYVKDIGNSLLLNAEKNRLFLSFLRASTLAVSDNILQTVIYNNVSTDNDNFNLDSAITTHGRIYSITQLIRSLNIISANLFKLLVIYERESIAQPHSIKAIHNIYPVIKSLVFAISNGFLSMEKTHTTINELNTFINNTIMMIDDDTSGYVNNNIDIDLNSPLKTNILISHDYNLI